VGWGGLPPGQTPRAALRNEFWGAVFNRLAANTLVRAGVPEAAGRRIFTVTYRDQACETVEALALALGVGARLVANSSAFGLMLCVKDDEFVPSAPMSKRKDVLARYAQLPYFIPCRTNLCTDPCTRPDETEVQMSYHCALEITLKPGSDTCSGGGEGFRLSFYLGPEGCTAFHAGNEGGDRPWSNYHVLDRPRLSPSEVLEAVKAASATSCVGNLASVRQSWTWGGYVVGGVCNDTVGVVEKTVRGTFSMFPYVASGDAKAVCAAVGRRELAPALREGGFEDAARYVESVADAFWQLPSDLQTAPGEALETIARFEESTLDQVQFFTHNRIIRERLAEAKALYQALEPAATAGRRK